MDAETFTELALRVVAGEASAGERATFERELAADPARRAEFEQFAALRTAAPMTEAAGVTGPELPAHRIGELRTAVRRHFGPLAAVKHTPLLDALRWLFAGGGLAGLAAIIVVLCFANRSIELGMYGSDLDHMRGGGPAFSAQDVPAAKLMTFAQDATFDAWQKQPLAWSEHAKIWVDNDNDQLHIVQRLGHGHVVTETQPLAANAEDRRTQIQQAVRAVSQ